MKAPARPSRSLQLESLESRTLLAGPGSPGFAGDFNLAVQSLSGTGAYDASFSVNFGNSQLVLTGETGSALTVNLDQLPAFVTNLRISSFASVTFLGTDHVANLVVMDVGAINGPNLSVSKSLHLSNVGSVDLASAGTMAVLKGSNTELSVDSLAGTMIYSDLQSLTIDSQSTSLVVVGLNSEQQIYLKYRPDSISVAGLTSASVHRVDDIVIPVDPPAGGSTGGSTGGETSGGGSSTGGGTDGGTIVPPPDGGTSGGDTSEPPTPTEDPINVITVPLDEQTRAFLAELRHLLRSSDADGQQLVFDFIARNSLGSGDPVAALAGNEFAPLSGLLSAELDRLAQGTGNADTGEIRSLNPAHDAAAALPVSDRFAGGSEEMAGSDLPAGLFPAGPMEIDATWPVAVLPAPTRDLHPATTNPVDEDRPVEIAIEDSVRAFGSFLAERVSAEYSAGEQSLVLLVDPRPSRPAGTNPTSALDQFARGNRTSLSSLQNVMG